MKFLLIAGFSNEEIRSHLDLKEKSRWVNWALKMLKLPSRSVEFRDHAQWVVDIINDFEKRNDIELHVLGPHIRLKRRIEEFQLRGVKYHFYQSEWTKFIRIVGNYKVWERLQNSSGLAKELADKIKPDLVILSGAENPTTSYSIMELGEYPRICLCQTILNDISVKVVNKRDVLKWNIEKEILQELNHVGVYCKKHYDLLRQLGYNGNIYKFNYPIENKEVVPQKEQLFDFVNFALNHSSAKGTQDSIRALAIVKQKYPLITLNIVGGVSDQLRQELKILIKNLDLEKNVIFTPFFERIDDLMNHIVKSRFAILPCKLDYISGTMGQSMSSGLPIVVYKTTGTPTLNKDKECALIADIDDVEGLAKHMITLLSNPLKAEELKNNGLWFMINYGKKSNDNWERMVKSMKAIVDYSNSGIPIPPDCFFNEKYDD